MHLYMHACTYVRMYVCMYVCMYACNILVDILEVPNQIRGPVESSHTLIQQSAVSHIDCFYSRNHLGISWACA